jgi:hypothetical protein
MLRRSNLRETGKGVKMKGKLAVGYGLGLLTGLVVGAAFALFFAPTTGEELRAMVSEQVAAARQEPEIDAEQGQVPEESDS